MDSEVIIVGGGLSGLSCARRLNEAKIPFQLLEAADQVGGRARTDCIDGFLLDRGFQVLLTAYPEAQENLDYSRLELGRFEPGALIRMNGRFERFADPWRRPRHVLATAMSPAASLGDKIRVALLRQQVCRGSLEDLYQRPETTTMASLRNCGFSDRIINRFFRPFLGGVFLDGNLETSSRMFEFVFRMFSKGDAALPAKGMGELAQQMAAELPKESVHCNSPVSRVSNNAVQLADGRELQGREVVVACEAPAAARLLGESAPVNKQTVTCIYFSANRPPVEEPILVLNGDPEGPINNLCVPSQVHSTYAPANKSLVSVTVLGLAEDPDSLTSSVRSQLQEWFGSEVSDWEHLKSYAIDYALPNQAPPALSPVEKAAKRDDGLFHCGDYLDTASIQGAMISGRRAAEQILSER